ncbi:MAG: membrane protein insertion efficiency factor YidD [Methanospirillum sp.]
MRIIKNYPVQLSILFINKIWKRNTGRHFNKQLNIRCRYVPSCSSYAILVLEKYGFFKGWWLALKRIWRCNNGVQPGTIDWPD